MKTDVYVSIDGLTYNQLDLYKDETIVMKYASKDLNDITKVFAPYSQDFTFEASKNNRKYLGFYGDTDVIKIKTDSKYYCKIYVGGQLDSFGFLKLKSVKYENNKAQSFLASFATSVTNLKDKLGDETIQDLTDTALIQWTRDHVSDLISSTETYTFDGIQTKVYVPLISNNRVWQYDSNPVALDNIKVGSTGYVNSSELRPAVNLNSILEFIKKKYNLLIELPIAQRPEFSKAFMWCNTEFLSKTSQIKLNCDNSMLTTYSVVVADGGNQPISSATTERKYSITQSLNAYKITKNSVSDSAWNIYPYCEFNINFQNLYNVSSTGDNKLDILLVSKTTGELITSTTQDYSEGNFKASIRINDSYFVTSDIEFYVYLQFSNPTTFEYTRTNLSFPYRKTIFASGSFQRYNFDFYQYENGNTYFASNNSFATINVFKALPNMKVIDFLTSLIKTFNLAIYDSSPDNDNLFFLTPANIEEPNQVYSKLEVDYTPYVDIKESTKASVEQYNYYNLKHTTSKYRSNVDFKRIYGSEYGQIYFPETKPTEAKEFKIETGFSIINPITIQGTNDLISAYGFTSDAPSIGGSGESRYTPNYDEPTIFYNNGIQTLTEDYLFQSGSTAPIVISKSTYQLTLPFLITNNGDSLGFSILVFEGSTYPNNLYSMYYQKQLERLIDPNVMAQSFTLNLPTNEMYLNEFTQNTTPTGFRLQNDVIIMENRFTILDAQIDKTTGKTKITLLNY
jgi:hypothetical protein